MITLAVFTIGIMGVFSYAVANNISVKDNYDRYLSANLGREGIEIIRNIRDSNWLKIDDNVDCNSATAGIQLCTWDQGLQRSYSIVDIANLTLISKDANFLNSDRRLYLDNDPASPTKGFYVYNSAQGVGSDIYRTMELRSICLEINTEVESVVSGAFCPGGAYTKIGIQAIAHMRWQRGSKVGQLELVDNLYNWRK